MAALQELANKHTLPAMSLAAIPSESLPDELRKKQLAAPGGHANEALYAMFAQSMEMRGNVRHCPWSLSGVLAQDR